tara:strand:+ start:906 stop:1355 length:450 start_codon:yes stop_codon:yes gene_type:complete
MQIKLLGVNNMETATKKQSIEDIALDHLTSRAKAIKDIMDRRESEDQEESDQADEEFYQYGLSFDYVHPFTFDDQRAGYWRWQISWGGPSEEFRIYLDEHNQPKAIDFTYLDWGEGHSITLDFPVNPEYDAIFNAVDYFLDTAQVREGF